MLSRMLETSGCRLDGVFPDPRLRTIEKNRLFARTGHQQILRFDRENGGELDGKVAEKLRRFVIDQAEKHDALVVSDYGKGVVHSELLNLVAEQAQKRGFLCLIDPKRKNFDAYRNASLLTPNREEASQASGTEIRDEVSLREAGKKLLEKWRSKAVLVTRGQEGMSLFVQGEAKRDFPTAAREVFDVTGAGDTVVAVCALALASGSTYEEAALLANLGAGIVVGEVGTYAVPWKELKRVVVGAG
jgi:D-beta-D-heptose 7-phosphate kinase/D-beta-D-heptose 1-phosphate adenosyltransferase